MNEIYFNGAFVPAAQGQVSVMDRGFLFGDGVYEVIPSYGGHFRRLEQHLDRLDDSLSGIRLDNPLTREEWQAILARLIGAPPAPDQSVYLQVTRGAPPERDHLCPAGVPPTVFAMANPMAPRRPEVDTLGVHCITRPDIRWQRCEFKAISLLAAVMMRPLEELTSADEVWITNSTREILPVTRLDGAPVGAWVPGPVWQRLNTLYQDYKSQVRQGHV